MGMDFLGKIIVVIYTYRADTIRIISAWLATKNERQTYEQRKFNFKKAKQGSITKPSSGKTRITIRIDTDILNWFRNEVHKKGVGNYQTLLNEALREFVNYREGDLEKIVRKIIREELKVLSK